MTTDRVAMLFLALGAHWAAACSAVPAVSVPAGGTETRGPTEETGSGSSGLEPDELTTGLTYGEDAAGEAGSTTVHSTGAMESTTLDDPKGPTTTSDPGEQVELEVELSGIVAKGPFILGSTVSVSELDVDGQPTGRLFMTETINDLGEFAVSFVTQEPYARIEGTGFYYNEITAGLSIAPLTLRAYASLADGVQDVHVNLVTHLIARRVETLVAAGDTVPDAIAVAELELDTALAIAEVETLEPGTSLTMTEGDTPGGRYLLAVAAVLAQAAEDADGPIDAELQSIVNEIANDLADDGEVNSSAVMERIAAAKLALNTSQVMADLETYLNENGTTEVSPNIDLVLDQDDDTLVNASDNCDLISNVGQEDADTDDIGDVCDGYPLGGPDQLWTLAQGAEKNFRRSFLKGDYVYILTRVKAQYLETRDDLYRVHLYGDGVEKIAEDFGGLVNEEYLFVSDTRIYVNMFDETYSGGGPTNIDSVNLWSMDLDGADHRPEFNTFRSPADWIHIDDVYAYHHGSAGIIRVELRSDSGNSEFLNTELPDDSENVRDVYLRGSTFYWTTEHTVGRVALNGSEELIEVVDARGGPEHETLYVTDTHIYWPTADRTQLERYTVDGEDVEMLWSLDQGAAAGFVFHGDHVFVDPSAVVARIQEFDFSSGQTDVYSEVLSISDRIAHLTDDLFVVPRGDGGKYGLASVPR